MARSNRSQKPGIKKPKRRGRPLVVYFSQEQAARLASLSQQRHVAKATIVRYAVDRLFVDIDNKQLDLPFGL